jgi:Uncharacterized stress-induced protein
VIGSKDRSPGATIENAAAGLADAYRQRLQKRIAELLNRGGQVVEIDPARLAQEVAYLADRSDVSEEMVRLRSHLTQVSGSTRFARRDRKDARFPLTGT